MADISSLVTDLIKKRGNFGFDSGFKEFALFSYPINHLAKKDKVRFYYALKGRDGRSGVIKLYGIERVSRGVLLVPIIHENDVVSFLERWKCKFKIRRVLCKDET